MPAIEWKARSDKSGFSAYLYVDGVVRDWIVRPTREKIMDAVVVTEYTAGQPSASIPVTWED